MSACQERDYWESFSFFFFLPYLPLLFFLSFSLCFAAFGVTSHVLSCCGVSFFFACAGTQKSAQETREKEKERKRPEKNKQMWTKLVGVAWEYHLTWLREEGHVTTASEASRLERYCQDHPRRIAKSDEAGCFPLHLAARNQRGEHSLTVVQALIAAFGHALQRKNNEGDLPLHLAARFQRGEYGLPLMSALMTAYPHGLQRRDIAGRLPLHCAAFQQQGRYAEALFTTLLIAYPEGLQEKTYDGNLPLHYAVLGHYSVVTIGKGRRALVMAVLKAFPEAAQKKNDSGNLPLHIAAANQTLPVVMALLKAYPEGVQQKSDSGALPLYYAAGNSEGTAVAVVRALLKAYPHAAQEKTNEGLLPLHMAAFYQRGEPHGIAVVTALLTAYPRGIMETNEKGQRPLTYSRGGRSDKALVDLMRKAEKGEWQPPAQGIPKQQNCMIYFPSFCKLTAQRLLFARTLFAFLHLMLARFIDYLVVIRSPSLSTSFVCIFCFPFLYFFKPLSVCRTLTFVSFPLFSFLFIHFSISMPFFSVCVSPSPASLSFLPRTRIPSHFHFLAFFSFIHSLIQFWLCSTCGCSMDQPRILTHSFHICPSHLGSRRRIDG